MTGQKAGTSGTGTRRGDQELVRVECVTNSRARGLSVKWTKGAIFEFGSRQSAETWTESESRKVPGRFFLAHPPDEEQTVPVDYYLKYSGGDS